MRKLSKKSQIFISSLLVSIMGFSVFPKHAEAAEINVPQYMSQTKQSVSGLIKYKDKTYIQYGGKNKVIHSNGTVQESSVNAKDIMFGDKIYAKTNGKSFVSSLYDETQYDLEKGTAKKVSENSTLSNKIINAVKKKFNLGSNDKIDIFEAVNHGTQNSMTWASFSINNDSKKGFINVSTLEIIDKSSAKNCYIVDVYDNKLIYNENGSLYVYENGKSQGIPASGGRAEFFKKGKAYLTYNWQNNMVSIYEMSGSSYIRVAMIEMNLGVTDIDRNGSLWAVNEIGGKTYICKYEDKSFKPKFEISAYPTNLSVYDDYKMAVSGSSNGGWYTVIDHKPTTDYDKHWGVDYINKAMEMGWINTTEQFRPNNSMTRAEFIKIVNRAFGYTEIGTEKFNDVYPNDWFYDEVRIAVKAGYITQNNTRFRPNDPISREEVAVIVTNIQKNKDTNYDKIKKYSDYKEISEWAKSSVEGVVEAGYMGVGVTSFYPLSNITRAEAVTTLIRVVE